MVFSIASLRPTPCRRVAVHGGKERFLPLFGCAVTNAVGFAWILRPALRLRHICFPPRWATRLLPTCRQKQAFMLVCSAAWSSGCFAVHDTPRFLLHPPSRWSSARR